MKVPLKVILASAAALAIGTAACSLAENSVSDSLRSAPAPVRAAVLQVAGTNKISEFDTETADGKTVYDLEYTVHGVDYAADIDPTGNVIDREVDVDMSFVPQPVIDAAKKAHPDGTLAESSIVVTGDKMTFSLDVKVGKDTHEMQFTAAGAVVADAIEPPEPGETADADKAGEKPEGKEAPKGEEKEDKD